MAQKKTKFYVVWKGRKTGIFRTWDECKEQIEHFADAQYKSFESEVEAQAAFKQGFVRSIFSKPMQKSVAQTKIPHSQIIQDSLAVDAACSGNPGLMEYRGVYVKTGKEVFHFGPIPDGTNNIGEFLAIVHGLAFLQQNQKEGFNIPIYSDSKIAQGWVRKGKCNTKLETTPRNGELFELIARAETWLATHTYSTPILKWETESWGEIPADFGRK